MTTGHAHERGFALLIVLLALALFSLLGTQILAAARQDTQLARNRFDAAALEAAANGAVQQAIFRFLDRSGKHWNADSLTRTIRIGRVPVAVRIENESDKVNPNYASVTLLRALLVETGANPAAAAGLAASIVQWRLAGGLPGRPDPIVARYVAAGDTHAPSGAPFGSLDELNAVLGMTPDLLARLAPHLTLFTDGNPRTATQDVTVARALASAGDQSGAVAMDGGDAVVSVTADARGNGATRFVIQVIVQTNARDEGSRYEILAYHRVSIDR